MKCPRCRTENMVALDNHGALQCFDCKLKTDRMFIKLHRLILKFRVYKCKKCWRLMIPIWDVVCFKCGVTLCYKHSQEKKGKWYCKDGCNKNKKFIKEM